MAMLYTYNDILLEIRLRTRRWCLKCVIAYLARDITSFVMYCVNGKPRSPLFIKNEKTFKNEQRNRDDAAKKGANTRLSGVEKSNNYYEDIYNIPPYNNTH